MRTAAVAARFAIVGAIGFALQLITIAGLVDIGWRWLPATAVGVEAAVVHNYVWHEAWTWRDRERAGRWPLRLLRFHLANGVGSMAANITVMWLLAAWFGLPIVLANAVAVGAAAMLNFVLADRWVFVGRAEAVLTLDRNKGSGTRSR